MQKSRDTEFIYHHLSIKSEFRNAVCIARSNRSRTSAELLAKYCDSILKKSTKMSDDDNEKERTMNDIVSLPKKFMSKNRF